MGEQAGEQENRWENGQERWVDEGMSKRASEQRSRWVGRQVGVWACGMWVCHAGAQADQERGGVMHAHMGRWNLCTETGQ